MITLIGIGHVFSIKEAVRYIILKKRPQAVCIELDRIRFDALENGNRINEEAPFLFKRLQRIYEKAAETQGASVGEEMLGAVEAAKEIGVPHFFIDVEASPMVMDLFQKLSMGEKMKLIGSVLGASMLPKSTLEDGIKKVSENPEQYMDQFEKAFPSLKRDIVDYRDKYMATRILQLSREHNDIIAVVGEGHVKGMQRYLSQFGMEIIHLSEVKSIAEKIRSGQLDRDEFKINDIPSNGNRYVQFSFELDPEEKEEI